MWMKILLAAFSTLFQASSIKIHLLGLFSILISTAYNIVSDPHFKTPSIQKKKTNNNKIKNFHNYFGF